MPSEIPVSDDWRHARKKDGSASTRSGGSHLPRYAKTTTGRRRRPPAAVIAFAMLAIVITLTGGSSRADSIWLIALRPISVLCIVVMALAGGLNWRSVRPLPLLLALFAATMVIQLVPLPPSLWLGLGGRESYDEVARTLGGTNQWHPLSVTPDRTWNSLIALLTPLGTIMGFMTLDERYRRLVLWPLLSLVVLSMVLGVAQIADGETSSLYWYRVSGEGQLIGFFANRNHQAALLAVTLPLLRAWMLLAGERRQSARVHTVAALSLAAAIVLYIFVLGSRAGVVLVLIGLVAAFLVEPSLGSGRRSRRQRWLIAGALVAGIAGLLALVLAVDRAMSVGRFIDNDLSTEGRFAALPTLMQIMEKTLPFGTGFGSFVPVFNSYEPDALLKPSYFNNAHNDLIELTITGGVPALLVLAVFLVWWLRASWRAFFAFVPRPWRALQRASAFAILILLLASLADYPLRTPLMGLVFTILCCWLAHEPSTGDAGNDA